MAIMSVIPRATNWVSRRTVLAAKSLFTVRVMRVALVAPAPAIRKWEHWSCMYLDRIAQY